MKKHLLSLKNRILAETFYIVLDSFLLLFIFALLLGITGNISLSIPAFLSAGIGSAVLLLWVVTYFKYWGMPIEVKQYQKELEEKNKKKYPNKWALRDRISLILFAIIIILIAFVFLTDGSFGGSRHVCPSCGRSYTGVSKGGMCRNCYDNFKWAQNALGK